MPRNSTMNDLIAACHSNTSRGLFDGLKGMLTISSQEAASAQTTAGATAQTMSVKFAIEDKSCDEVSPELVRAVYLVLHEMCDGEGKGKLQIASGRDFDAFSAKFDKVQKDVQSLHDRFDAADKRWEEFKNNNAGVVKF
jgi:hypothetical protein